MDTPRERRLRRILTTFNAQAAQFDQISVIGRSTEVVVSSEEVQITASGSAATRLITLPGSWIAPASVTASGLQYRLDYQGGEPTTVVFKCPPSSTSRR